MNKHIVLGINRNKDEILCNIIYPKVSFESLLKILDRNLPIDKFVTNDDSTDWAGRDEISRTLQKRNLKPTGRVLDYNRTYEGSDYDCSHSYPWRFQINEIWEVEEGFLRVSEDNSNDVGIKMILDIQHHLHEQKRMRKTDELKYRELEYERMISSGLSLLNRR